ncbi:hypothetical protein [Ostreiculturibacter nitratireducens]|uniref:hypothetical protein n=1 Tax=Ostreiculturibacter nitratireducens TaxID=3075226 RepID=UPI0031B64E85
MAALVWLGAAVTVAGLVGLVYCILSLIKARNAGLSDEDLRARLKQLMAWNLGAFFLSVIGLMMVVVGILVG